MVTPELQAFVDEQRKSGAPPEAIRSQLLGAGWPVASVDEAVPVVDPVPEVAAQAPAPPTAVTQKPASSMRILLPVLLVLLLGGGGYMGYQFWQGRAKTPATPVTTPTPTPTVASTAAPAGLKSPSSYSDTLETLTGWVPPGQTVCKTMSVKVIPIPFDAIDEQQKLLGGTGATPLDPKVAADGSFSILIDKGKNVEVLILDASITTGTPQTCLQGIQLTTDTGPLRVDASSTAEAQVVETGLASFTADQRTILAGKAAYKPLRDFMIKTLPTATLVAINDPKGKYFETYFNLTSDYVKSATGN